MPDNYQAYNCFISSPGDVKDERRLAEEVILRINRTFLDILKVSLNVKKWENLPPITPHLPEEKIQDILNREVEQSHFFILILYKRYGTIEPGYTISNTERELNTILELYKRRPQIKILVYFRELQSNDDPGTQEQKVLDFRKRLENMGIMYKLYVDSRTFKDELTHDLYDSLLRMHISTFKSRALFRFWQLGEVDRTDIPRLAIMYPPISRSLEDPQKARDYWLTKLVPSLYFEDHKAIEKLRKIFTIISFHDYGVFCNMDMPSDWQRINRVWISLSRFGLANKQLQKYAGVSRFEFTPPTERYQAQIKWKSRDGSIINISSPLRTYLQLQREKMNIGEDWQHQLGRVVAKDYAVLARFTDQNSSDVEQYGFLHDYFLTGIHGLGTWGAAWFIDRRYRQFAATREDEDFQTILEVTYMDNKIFDVQNVSEQPVTYFNEQLSRSHIRKIIADYRQ